MNLEALSNLSWREALIAVVVLLALYVIVVFLRMRRLRQRAGKTATQDHFATKSALAAYAAVQNPEAPAPETSVEPIIARHEPVPLAEPSNTAFPWNEPPEDAPGHRRIAALERELNQLRREVGGLRAEVLVLKEALQREHVQAQATQNVSPLYSDAMQMAMQGHDVLTISQHCGISRAEAELVVALVRNQDSA